MELFGRDYVIDHCVSEEQEYQENKAYRIYMTDALKVIGHLNLRYADLFKPVETRTADEIKLGIVDKLKAVKD